MQRQQRAPPALDAREHRVDGASGLVAPEHGVQVVALVLDHCHPRPQDSLAVVGQGVNPPSMARGTGLVPSVNEPVALELRECAVHAGPVDVAEPKCPQVLDEVVAVALLLGQQQQDGGEQEPPRRRELEARAAPGDAMRRVEGGPSVPPLLSRDAEPPAGSTGPRIVRPPCRPRPLVPRPASHGESPRPVAKSHSNGYRSVSV